MAVQYVCLHAFFLLGKGVFVVSGVQYIIRFYLSPYFTAYISCRSVMYIADQIKSNFTSRKIGSIKAVSVQSICTP